MRLKNILFVILGIVIGVAGFSIYVRLKPRPTYFWSEIPDQDKIRLVGLQEEVSNQRKNAIVIAANKVGPAVVSITVIQTRIVTTEPFYSPFADDFFDQFFRDFFPPRRYKEKIQSLGSGVIISPDGYILTNEHVITNATEIKITLPDGRQFNGRVIGTDAVNDVALLKIDGKDLPYAPLGDSDELIIGEWVIALGNPFGFLLEDTHPTVTVGVVSALHRSIKSRGLRTREERIYKDMIQTDAAINPGNSGGPLVNVLGEVIGINTFIFSSGGGSEGVGFALPINLVKHIIAELKVFGRKREIWLGIAVQDLTDDLAQALNIEKRGILISNVEEGSPAQRAGLKAGDQIVEAQGKMINRVTDWEGIENNLLVGDSLSLKILHDGGTVYKKLVVEEFSQEIASKRLDAIGIKIVNINFATIRRFGLMRNKGVVVVEIKRGSLGEKLGLKPGDIILQWGSVVIRDVADFLNITFNLQGDVTIIIDRKGMILEIIGRI